MRSTETDSEDMNMAGQLNDHREKTVKSVGDRILLTNDQDVVTYIYVFINYCLLAPA